MTPSATCGRCYAAAAALSPLCAFAADEPKPVLGINDFEGNEPLKNVTATNAELSLTKSDVLAGTQSLEITFKPGQEVAEIVFSKLPKGSWMDYAAFSLFGKVKGTGTANYRQGVMDSNGAEYLPELEFTPNARPIEAALPSGC